MPVTGLVVVAGKSGESPDDAPSAPAAKPSVHWAYVKLVRPAAPAVRDASWVRNPIDAFVLARLVGEFGRTPMNEGRNNSKFLGRDHHPRGFIMWMAGGGSVRAPWWGRPTSWATTPSRTRWT